MADQEVIKHTKKVYKIWNSKEHNFLHKLKEFVLEIFIIVFAVSLSIWLHSWSEHGHQQKEVKEFLTDLKQDLLQDIQNMTEQENATKNAISNFDTLRKLTSSQIDSLENLKATIKLELFPTNRKTNSGNYEGFKSSGNIGFIETKKLKSQILNYYQQDILALEELENIYNKQLFRLQELAASKKDKKEMYLDHTVKSTLLYLTQYGKNRVEGYEALTLEAKAIIKEIDKELN